MVFRWLNNKNENRLHFLSKHNTTSSQINVLNLTKKKRWIAFLVYKHEMDFGYVWRWFKVKRIIPKKKWICKTIKHLKCTVWIIERCENRNFCSLKQQIFSVRILQSNPDYRTFLRRTEYSVYEQIIEDIYNLHLQLLPTTHQIWNLNMEWIRVSRAEML